MTPANERKAAERKRKREAGLVRLEMWVPSGKEEYIKARVADITRAEATGVWVKNSDMHSDTNIYGRRWRIKHPDGRFTHGVFGFGGEDMGDWRGVEWFFEGST